MRLVLRLVGGATFAAALALVAACAHGGTSSVDGVDDDAGLDGGTPLPRDGSLLPPSPIDEAGSDAPTGSDAGCGKTVVINEVQTAGASASDEFVELMNRGTCTVPLGSWKLQYRSSGDGLGVALYTFGAGDSIPAGGRVFVANGSGSFSGKLGTLTPGMAAAAGQVGLLDDTGALVDGVAYGSVSTGTYLEGSAAPSPPTSGSIARKPDGTDTNNNASDFKTAATPTPGAPN
jgi:hypothetical protein